LHPSIPSTSTPTPLQLPPYLCWGLSKYSFPAGSQDIRKAASRHTAEDTKLDRQVALKLLPREFAEDNDQMNRFVREAKSASALSLMNFVLILDLKPYSRG
jgi:serine/threonine protein kinase